MVVHTRKTANETLALYANGERYFFGIDLENEDFRGAVLVGVSFEYCWMSCVDFGKAKLAEVSFRNCNVKCANFAGADLRNAEFGGSAVEAISLEDANLDGVSFEGATSYGGVFGKGEMPN